MAMERIDEKLRLERKWGGKEKKITKQQIKNNKSRDDT
jgi:hypothetical protein